MYAKDYHDLGTPAGKGESVTLDIDGATVTVPAGTSIMRAAALADHDIPKLCATDTLKHFGSCRVCLVEIEGRKGFPASCTTEVAAGMKVRTQSEALSKMRRGVLELYVSEHPMGSCPDSSRCELETLAEQHGIGESRFAGPKTSRHVHTHKPVDHSNPYFRFDNDLCIVCSRCVRACEETQGTYALTIDGRGLESRVAASQDETFLDSECVSCGACVEACPTGALMEKSVLVAGLPQKAVPTTCAYCGVGCALIAEVTNGAVSRMVPNRNGRANQGHACVKGRFAYGYATHADRVTKPLIRKSITDEWTEVSWEEAISYAASEFRRIQAKYGRDSIGGITSSRCTNEETFPGAEAGACGLRHQQRRHLRARLPLAHGLRPQAHAG
jgi:formate dehydrogenase major subunit